MTGWGTWVLRIYVGVVVVFLFAPVIVVIASAFNGADLLDFPPSSLSVRWFGRFWESDVFREAFFASLDDREETETDDDPESDRDRASGGSEKLLDPRTAWLFQ